MVDDHDFDRTFSRLQLQPELPLDRLENRGAFKRLTLIHVEVQIDVIQSGQSGRVDDGVTAEP